MRRLSSHQRTLLAAIVFALLAALFLRSSIQSDDSQAQPEDSGGDAQSDVPLPDASLSELIPSSLF